MHKHLLSNFKITFKLSKILLLCARLAKIKVSGKEIFTQVLDFRDDYINLYVHHKIHPTKGILRPEAMLKYFIENF